MLRTLREIAAAGLAVISLGTTAGALETPPEEQEDHYPKISGQIGVTHESLMLGAEQGLHLNPGQEIQLGIDWNDRWSSALVFDLDNADGDASRFDARGVGLFQATTSYTFGEDLECGTTVTAGKFGLLRDNMWANASINGRSPLWAEFRETDLGIEDHTGVQLAHRRCVNETVTWVPSISATWNVPELNGTWGQEWRGPDGELGQGTQPSIIGQFVVEDFQPKGRYKGNAQGGIGISRIAPGASDQVAEYGLSGFLHVHRDFESLFDLEQEFGVDFWVQGAYIFNEGGVQGRRRPFGGLHVAVTKDFNLGSGLTLSPHVAGSVYHTKDKIWQNNVETGLSLAWKNLHVFGSIGLDYNRSGPQQGAGGSGHIGMRYEF